MRILSFCEDASQSVRLCGAPYENNRDCRSVPGILSGIGQGLGLIVSDVLNAQILEDLEQSLAVVTESNSTVMRIALLDQNVAIEAAHFGNGEDTDAAEGTGLDRQNLALSDIGAQNAVAVALQAIECDVGAAMSPSRVPRVKSGSLPAGSSRRCWMS